LDDLKDIPEKNVRKSLLHTGVNPRSKYPCPIPRFPKSQASRTTSTLPGTHTSPALVRLSGADFGPPFGALLGERALSLGDEELVLNIAVRFEDTDR